MALRKPLVLNAGQIEQLQAADTLDVAANLTVTVTNDNAGAITEGMPVYISGADAVDKARANAEGTATVFALVKDASIDVDAERVRGMVTELASTYQEPEEVVNYYYNNQQMLAGVESAVLEDQVVDYILGKANVTDVVSTYDDVIKPSTPESGAE